MADGGKWLGLFLSWMGVGVGPASKLDHNPTKIVCVGCGFVFFINCVLYNYDLCN